jgi:hypothetical protein
MEYREKTVNISRFVHEDLNTEYLSPVLYVVPYVHHISSNACVVPPLPRPVRQENADTTTETVRAGKYAKITERGCGQYQRVVSNAFCTSMYV